MSTAAPSSRLTAREHHLPAAAFAVARGRACSSASRAARQTGRLAAVLVLQLGLVLCWVLVTGIQGFAGSLAVGAAAAVAADLALVLPEDPELGDLLVVFGVGLPGRRAAADGPPAAGGPGGLAGRRGADARRRRPAGRPAAARPHGRRRPSRALVALLAVGAALVVGHLVDLVLPRPQLADGVPRGLLGVVLAVLAPARCVAFAGAGRRRRPRRRGAPLVHGVVMGGVAALTALVASYVVVEATAAGRRARRGRAAVSRWVLPVIQVALPIAACAPVVLALQAAL